MFRPAGRVRQRLVIVSPGRFAIADRSNEAGGAEADEDGEQIERKPVHVARGPTSEAFREESQL